MIGNHTFRRPGSPPPKHGSTLEKTATMANHALTRTSQFPDHRSDVVTLDEVERVLIWRCHVDEVG